MDYLYDFAFVDFTAWIYPSLMVQFDSTRVMQKEQQRMNYKSYFCNDPDSVGCAGFAFRNYTISMCIDPCTFLYCCLECSIARRGKASKSKQIRTKDRRCSPTTKSWMNKKGGFFFVKIPTEWINFPFSIGSRSAFFRIESFHRSCICCCPWWLWSRVAVEIGPQAFSFNDKWANNALRARVTLGSYGL